MRDINYAEKAKELRRTILQTLHNANGSFSGGSLSSIDLLTVLFHGFMRLDSIRAKAQDRDIFILSKGHCSSALYTSLVSVGIMPADALKTYGKDGSVLGVHPKKDAYPGIETSSGSLGHGLALASGSALAAKILHNDAMTYVLMGDGECNEGSVCENAAFASRQKLNNLVVMVDRNRLQGCGTDEAVLNYGDMAEKFRAFGFHAIDIDGHNYDQIEAALKIAAASAEKPTAIIAHTIKGRGVSFMENRLEWHYKSPSDEQLNQAMEELK